MTLLIGEPEIIKAFKEINKIKLQERKKRTTKCYTQKMVPENENIILHHYNSYYKGI